MVSGYNRGDVYEEKILRICIERGLTPSDFKRGGAGNSVDLLFNHFGIFYNLEIKADTKADFGQKMLKWNSGTWDWCLNDEVTKLYSVLGMLDIVQNMNFTPYRFTVFPKESITQAQKSFDQRSFEKSTEIDVERLFLYYKLKNTHYIQIGGFGFYYLDEDVLNLGVPQFDGRLNLRFRAKTIHSNPIYKYGFYAVLKVRSNPSPSPFDIEELKGKVMPPITPQNQTIF